MWEDKDEKPADSGEPEITETPTEQPESVPKESGKGGGKGKEKADPEVVALRKELDALKKRNEELSASERYWAELASGKRKPETGPESEEEEPEEPEETEEDDGGVPDDTPDKAFEEFSARGVEALVKRGVLTKKAAREIIRKEAEKIASKIARTEVAKAQQKYSADAALIREFPDLGDPKSALFARTRDIYRGMVEEDESLKRSPGALKMAAKLAKAELAAEAPPKRDREDRLDRIRRQGETGRSLRGAGIDDDDDALSPAQKSIIEKFNRDGGITISEEKYKARVKEGVRMKYTPGQVNW